MTNERYRESSSPSQRKARFQEALKDAEEVIAEHRENLRKRAGQPARLAAAREKARAARTQALVDEPWEAVLSVIPGYTPDGEIAGMAAVPSIDGKALFGTRLAYDLLGCCDNEDQVSDVVSDYFRMVNNDTAHLSFIAVEALEAIVTSLMPKMLQLIESRLDDWDMRVNLADAAYKTWSVRVADFEMFDDEAGDDV